MLLHLCIEGERRPDQLRSGGCAMPTVSCEGVPDAGAPAQRQTPCVQKGENSFDPGAAQIVDEHMLCFDSMAWERGLRISSCLDSLYRNFPRVQ